MIIVGCRGDCTLHSIKPQHNVPPIIMASVSGKAEVVERARLGCGGCKIMVLAGCNLSVLSCRLLAAAVTTAAQCTLGNKDQRNTAASCCMQLLQGINTTWMVLVRYKTSRFYKTFGFYLLCGGSKW